MKIHVERPNRLGRQVARQRIDDQIAAAMAEHKDKVSGLRLDWLQGNPQVDTLSVGGSVYGTKINGNVNVDEDTLTVDAEVSGPLTWLIKKDRVESMISQELEKLGL